MPIGTSDGKYYEDDFDFFTNNGKEVVDPKTVMPPNTDSKMEVLDPQMIRPDVLDSQRDLEISSQRRLQDASISHTEPRTDVLQGPEVSTYQTEMEKSQMGLRDTIRQGAQAIQEATGIGKESFVQDFLTKFKNSKELLDQYFEGKIEPNDPNLVNAVTTLASTAGGVGIASAPLRTSSVGTFGGTLGLKEIAKTSPKSLESFADAIVKTKENANPVKIWEETGWWRDPRDGMWKFEISDKEVKMDPSKITDGNWTFKENKWEMNGGVSLNELISHPKLFKAYPELKDIKVVYNNFNKTDIAAFYPATETNTPAIAVTDKFVAQSKEQQVRTVLHEIQHWIQHKENFGRSQGGDLKDPKRDYVYWQSPGEVESRNVETRYSRDVRNSAPLFPPASESPTGYSSWADPLQ